MSSLSALKILELQIIEKPVCVIEETNSKKKKKSILFISSNSNPLAIF